MVFDEQFSMEILQYGVGLMADAGKYHFVASLAQKNKIKQLCLSQRKDLADRIPKKIKWFPDESCAIKALQENPKACHKCMRAIETLTLGYTPIK